MATMQDSEMEQLSRLFARGNLSDARKISRLLKAECDEDAGDRTGIDMSKLAAIAAKLFRK
jgi:hypothetical protein